METNQSGGGFYVTWELIWATAWHIIQVVLFGIGSIAIWAVKQVRKGDIETINEQFSALRDRVTVLEERLNDHHEHHPGPTRGTK